MRRAPAQLVAPRALWLALTLAVGSAGLWAAATVRPVRAPEAGVEASRASPAPVRVVEPGEHPSPSQVTELASPLAARASGASRRVDFSAAGWVAHARLAQRRGARCARAPGVQRAGDRPFLPTCSSQGPPARA